MTIVLGNKARKKVADRLVNETLLNWNAKGCLITVHHEMAKKDQTEDSFVGRCA
jgi:hypothetical protein